MGGYMVSWGIVSYESPQSSWQITQSSFKIVTRIAMMVNSLEGCKWNEILPEILLYVRTYVTQMVIEQVAGPPKLKNRPNVTQTHGIIAEMFHILPLFYIKQTARYRYWWVSPDQGYLFLLSSRWVWTSLIGVSHDSSDLHNMAHLQPCLP